MELSFLAKIAHASPAGAIAIGIIAFIWASPRILKAFGQLSVDRAHAYSIKKKADRDSDHDSGHDNDSDIQQ